MSLALPLLFWLLACAGVAFALFYKSLISDRDSRIAELQNENNELKKSRDDFIASRAKLEQENVNLMDKVEKRKEEIENARKEFRTEFENIANKIFESNRTTLTQENKEQVGILLQPLREKLGEFQEKVEKTSTESVKTNATLLEQIRQLTEMNKNLSDDAKNLTKALKGDSKAQGNWGELVLEDLLSRSGLEKGREYIVQGEWLGLKNERGNASKPDVLIMLPDGKNLVIDAKVSLTAYERLISAEEEDRPALLKDHIRSLKAHIDELAGKDYTSHSELRSPDFVMMFVPIEASLSLALQSENDLFVYGWDKRIILVTPTTLLMSLRTVANLWRHEKQSQNVLEIARVGGQLYDKFVGFLEDMEGIKKSLERTLETHGAAMNKLSTGRGNIIWRVEEMRKLGAKTEKQIEGNLLWGE
jgi:DNA recombination protein RmuC